MLDLSIIVVSFNARDDLERCLGSLHAPAPRASHEIIVVDNASTDGSADAARAWPEVQIIELAQNVGFARGNNVGIRASAGALLLLLNSDAVVPPQAIDRLISELAARPDVAVMGPRLVDGSGRPELSFGRMIGPFNELRQKLLARGHARRLPIVSPFVERLTRRPQVVDWVSGACLLVRRDDAFAAGLLDERYFMYTEDVDFCAAVRKRGRHVWFTPEVEIVHARGRSARAAPAATAAAYHRSRLAFYDKHHPFWAPLLRVWLRWRGADI
jgi:hypothetical protein